MWQENLGVALDCSYPDYLRSIASRIRPLEGRVRQWFGARQLTYGQRRSSCGSTNGRCELPRSSPMLRSKVFSPAKCTAERPRNRCRHGAGSSRPRPGPPGAPGTAGFAVLSCLDSAPWRREGQMSICLRRREFVVAFGGGAAACAAAAAGHRVPQPHIV